MPQRTILVELHSMGHVQYGSCNCDVCQVMSKGMAGCLPH